MDVWLSAVAVTTAVLLVVGALAVLRSSSTSSNNGGGGAGVTMSRATIPRGSFGWPFLGETLDFVSCAYSSRPESFADKRRLLYGKVFKSHIFGEATIVSTDAEVSRMVLQSDASKFVPWYPKSVTELMGKSSILLLNGPQHRRLHGLVAAFLKSPAFKAQITADMDRHVSETMRRWHDGQLVHIQHNAKSIVFRILVRGLIGLEPGPEMGKLKQHFQQFIAGLISLPIKIPGSRLYRSLQAKRRMAMLMRGIIQEKRRKLQLQQEREPPQDAVDVLVGCGELSDELISDNMIDLMIPAEDSVPVLITLAVYYLATCPEALQQLQEENMRLKLSKSMEGEALLWTDYMSLTFTQHVITESLRMGSIISGIMRKAVSDVEVKGHLIPKGWCVFLYFRSLHVDGAVYHEPYTFNPWRWKGKEGGGSACGGGSINFTPFGGGQRLCPGLELARLEASIFLHHLVTSFTWTAEKDEIINFPTVRLRRGLPVRVYHIQ